MKKTLLLIILSLFYIQRISAQVVLTSTTSTYTQDFNTLPSTATGIWANNTTLPGWYAQYDNVLLNILSATMLANTGSVTNAGLYSFGFDKDLDRALGGFAATSNPLNYGLRLVNNTGAPVQSFTVSFTLEQWYLSSLGTESLAFSYKTGSDLTSLTSGTWTSVPGLTAISPSTGTSGTRDGNLSANRVVVTATIYNVNLANGQEILFRWKDAKAGSAEDHGLGIDDVSVTPKSFVNFYSKPTGALNLLSTWGSNPDGSGASPASFSADNQIFYIHNTTNATINADWVVSGQNSRVILGNNTTSVQFSVNSQESFQGTIDVNNNATLLLANAVLPKLGTLAPGSTLVLQSMGDHVIDGTAFGNLTIDRSGNKSLAGNTTVAGTLTLTTGNLVLGNYNLRVAGSISGGSASSYVVTNGTGTLERRVAANNTAVIFPIGNGTFTPAELLQPSTGTSDFFRVRVIKGFYSGYDALDNPVGNARTTKAVNRTWIVKEEIKGGSKLTLKLLWDVAEQLPDFSPTKAQVNHYHSGVWTSTKPGSSRRVNGFYVQTMANISNFSPFSVSAPGAISYFYSKSTGNLDDLKTWGTNLDGSGTSPANFINDEQVFFIRNNPAPALKGHWTVSGVESKIVLTNNMTFDVGEKFTFRGLMDIQAGATLRLGYYTSSSMQQPVFGEVDPSSTVVFYSKTGHPLPLFSEDDHGFGNLTIAGQYTKTLSQPVTVRGQLQLTAGSYLALGNNDLRIAATGSLLGGSSSGFIITNGTGALVRSVANNDVPVFFPIGIVTGDGKLSFTPAALKQSLLGVTDFYRVRVFKGSYKIYDAQDNPLGEPLTSKVVDRTWVVSEEVPTGSDLTLNTYWTSSEVLKDYKNEEAQINHFDNGIWIPTLIKGAKVDVSKENMYTQSMSGITTFSPFITDNDGAVEDPVVLPVDLLQFAASRREQQVRLNWTTAIEKNNDFFTVEASHDGLRFREIGQVKGAGNSQVIQQYSFSHRSNTTATTYYRLKQTDLDRKYSYSQIVAVKGMQEVGAVSQLSVYPNPATGRFYIQGDAAAGLQALVTDLSGKQVLAQPLNLAGGQHLIDLSAQAPGVYLLTLVTANARQVLRLVKE